MISKYVNFVKLHVLQINPDIVEAAATIIFLDWQAPPNRVGPKKN